MRANDTSPVVIVTGPRQVGKTTMLKKLAGKGRGYVSLSSRINREMAINEPELFLQRYPPPVLIDEFQYAKELLPHIKAIVDKNKRNGDYWLSGAQIFHMMKQINENLSGQVSIVPMQGLSTGEILKERCGEFTVDPSEWQKRAETRKPQNLEEIYIRIFKGAMPRAYSGAFNREAFYSSYVEDYLQKDVRDLTQVVDEVAFLQFMTACAARTGLLLNYAELAKDVGISPPTAKQWLSILLASGIITRVGPYFHNALKRIVKAPKMYFMDTGLCAYLTRWDSPKTLEISAMNGQIFETYVVGEVIRSYYNVGMRPPISYYRDTDQKEIDLIFEVNNVIYPFEIKKTASPNKADVRHFDKLKKTQKKIGTGGVISMTDNVYPIKKDNYHVPVWLI